MERKPFIYLASPFKDEDSEYEYRRYLEINGITSWLLLCQDEFIPFSPIAYTYEMSFIFQGKPFDWVAWDLNILAISDGAVFVKMEGYENSKGMQKEMEYCDEHGIPYAYAEPNWKSVLDAYECMEESINVRNNRSGTGIGSAGRTL